MEVFHIKSISHPVLDPKSLFCSLAFRAMAVATAIVADAFLTTRVANIFVSAKGRRPALMQGIEGSYHKTIGLALINILLPKPIDDLGNLELRAMHYF